MVEHSVCCARAVVQFDVALYPYIVYDTCTDPDICLQELGVADREYAEYVSIVDHFEVMVIVVRISGFSFAIVKAVSNSKQYSKVI